MVESEKHWRAELMEGGVRAAQRDAFEILPEARAPRYNIHSKTLSSKGKEGSGFLVK